MPTAAEVFALASSVALLWQMLMASFSVVWEA